MARHTAAAAIPAATLFAQTTFRALMSAMAHPGRIHELAACEAPMPLMPATAAIALALFDAETPLWMDETMAANPEVAKWLRFNAGFPVTEDPSRCAFALVADGAALPRLEAFALGSADYPDRSTTLLIQVESLTRGATVTMRGPGIDGSTSLRAEIRPPDLIERLAATHALFPRGVDVIFIAGTAIAAVPRSTRFPAMEG